MHSGMAELRDTEVPCTASVSQSGIEQMEQPVSRDALGQGQTWAEMGL